MTKNWQKLFDIIGNIPMTNVRIGTTILIVGVTTIRYVAGGWEPSGEWLMFLASMAGIDSLHFTAKRMTAWRDTSTTVDESTGSTDVSEIAQEQKG